MTAREARVEAQAKLNLFLRVLARDESGYHQLETLFCRIALSDTVTVRTKDSSRRLDVAGARITAAGLGPTERNLAWRAAEAYAGATGFPGGFEIRVEKRIPVGGGLGGGSADAGAVLRALNALNPAPIGPVELLGIASTLGADVPFLTQDTSPLAVGRGYGERLTILAPLPPSAVWLLMPAVPVGTADAYRWLDESGHAGSAMSVSADQVTDWEGIAGLAGNDFEGVVGAKVPIVGRLLANLRSEGIRPLLGPSPIVLMSGSGSTVAVVSGQSAHFDLEAPPPIPGVELVETETSDFVEQVVLTH